MSTTVRQQSRPQLRSISFFFSCILTKFWDELCAYPVKLILKENDTYMLSHNLQTKEGKLEYTPFSKNTFSGTLLLMKLPITVSLHILPAKICRKHSKRHPSLDIMHFYAFSIFLLSWNNNSTLNIHFKPQGFSNSKLSSLTH